MCAGHLQASTCNVFSRHSIDLPEKEDGSHAPPLVQTGLGLHDYERNNVWNVVVRLGPYENLLVYAGTPKPQILIDRYVSSPQQKGCVRTTVDGLIEMADGGTAMKRGLNTSLVEKRKNGHSLLWRSALVIRLSTVKLSVNYGTSFSSNSKRLVCSPEPSLSMRLLSRISKTPKCGPNSDHNSLRSECYFTLILLVKPVSLQAKCILLVLASPMGSAFVLIATYSLKEK